MPIDSITVKDALTDVASNKATILCPETYIQHDILSWMDLKVADDKPCIRTVDGKINVPKIIIKRYDKLPRKKVVFNRRNLYKRDRGACQYCGVRPPSDDWTIDHVIPRSQGGTTRFDNCVVACTKCNRFKANRTPEQAGMKLRRQEIKSGVITVVYYDKPVVPRYSPYYNIRKSNVPIEWSQFLPENMVSEMYWNIELES